ncbi:MAG TPA: serine/threonine-protein kinase [Planctomycetota bacterium]|nr:serine/threonine-protein kinase [Planctomycetota bacterium]
MTPTRIVILTELPTRIPLVVEPFWIGRDAGSDLCLWDLRISRQHAKITVVHGEHVLAAQGDHPLWVNGAKVPVMTLRDGDIVSLTPPDEPDPIRLRFENELEGAFVPPGSSLTAAWQEMRKARGADVALDDRYELLEPLAGPGPVAPSRARDRATGHEIALKALPPVALGAPADAWVRLVAVLAGGSHPAIGRVLDGGVVPDLGVALRWVATKVVRGRPASTRIEEGPQALLTVVRRVRALANGLNLLHERGVVHGAVVPSHILLTPSGSAVLVGLGRTFLVRDGPFPPSGPRTEIEYTAPELLTEGAVATPATDVYGVGSLAHGILTGSPPFPAGTGAARGAPGDVARPGSPVPEPLREAVSRAMDPDPAQRPTAAEIGDVCAFVESELERTTP